MAASAENSEIWAPTLTASFLFADLVASTELRIELGDDANEVLEQRLMAVLRAAAGRHGGEEVRSLGDGIAVAFRGTAASAVGCAVDMQRSVRRLAVATGGLALQLRVGLAAGEVAPPRGGQWSGGPVVEAARLVEAAEPNTILATDVVRALVGSKGGFSFAVAGEQALKGFPEPVACCTIGWATADADEEAGPEPEEHPLGPASPYRGLLPFREGDAAVFWGRENETADLSARLVERKFVALIGASGSGKSSMLRAGLLPAIRRGAIPWGREGRFVTLTPGARPTVELASALALVLGLSVGTVLTQIEGSADGAANAIEPDHTRSPLVVLVDQFEELFTAGSSGSDRDRFVESLIGLAHRPDVYVVAAIRSDFLGRCAEIRDLAHAVSDGALLLPPVGEAGMRNLIERPAEAAGVRLESGLVELMLRDVHGQPGGLPLLSHALYETWKRRRNGTMTISGYTESGGVLAAISASADAEFDQLTEEEKPLGREILVRLTELGEGTEDTRRRVPRAALESLAPEVPAILDRFTDARLLTIDGDVVEVAHEALIREWPRLRAWLDADRERLRVLRHLNRAAMDWDERGRDDADLYRGARLHLARSILDDAHLDAIERSYLDASSELADRTQAALAHEASERARQNRRLRWSLGLLAAALVVALGAAGLAVIQSNRAADNEAAALARTQEADYQRLVSQSSDLLPTDRRLGALLAVEALRLRPGPEARTALLRVFERTPRFLGALATPVTPTAAAPAGPGRMLLVDAAAGVTLISTRTGRPTSGRLQLGERPSGAVTTLIAARSGPQPDDAPVVVARTDDGSVYAVDPKAHRASRVRRGGGRVVAAAINGPDGEVAVATPDGVIERQSGRGTALPALTVDQPISAIAFLPRRERMLVLSSGTISTWDLRSGQRIASAPTGSPRTRLDTAAGTIATRSDGAQAVAFDPSTGGMIGVDAVGRVQFRRDLDSISAGAWLAYSPGGGRLFRTDDRGRVAEVNTTSGSDLDVLGQTQVGRQTALVALDDETLAVPSAAGPTIELWSTVGASPIVTHLPGPGLAPTEFSPNGSTLLTQQGERPTTFDLWDPATGTRLQHAIPIVGAGFSGPNELGAFFDAGTGGYYDLVTQARVGPSTEIDVANVLRGRNTEELTVLSYRDGRVEIYDRKEEALRLTLETKGAIQLSIRPDGDALAVTSPAGEAAIYDTATGEILLDGLRGITDLAFDQSGTRLYVATDDGRIRTIDASTGRTVEPHFDVAPTPSAGIRVDCCGRWLGAVDYAGAMRLYDVATGDQIGDELSVNPGGTWTGALDPAGRWAAVQVPTGIDVFDLELDHWVEGACKIAGRNLTAEEWNRFLPNAGPRRRTCPTQPL